MNTGQTDPSRSEGPRGNADAAFQALNQDLERRVAERTAELRKAHDQAAWLARFPQENPNPTLRVSADGTVLYRNPACAQTPGWPHDAREPLAAPLLPLVARAMAEGRQANQDVELGGKWYAVWVAPFPGECYANVYARDITERKANEARIERLTKLYAVLSRVNEAIVRLHGEDELFAEVCKVVAQVGEFPLVWIGRVEGGRVVPVASAGLQAEYLKSIRVETDGDLSRGPTGTCLREGQPVLNDDFDSNPATAPWRAAALKHGFRASAAFPLRRDGKPVASLTLCAGQPGTFDREQMDLLEALAADVSYALDALRQERLRAEAEEALRLAEKKSRDVLESIHDGFYSLDRQWRFTYVNARALGLWNVRAEELLGKCVWDVFPKAVQTESHARLQRAMSEGVQESFETLSPYLNQWVHVRVYPSAEGVSVYFVDITNRKRAEEALRQSERRYRTLFDTMVEGFAVHEIICDAAGKPVDYRFLDANPAFERHTGLKVADLLGRTVREVLPQTEPEWIERYGRVALTGQSEHFELWHEGLRRWYDLSAYQTESGRFAVVFSDMTLRRQAEELLRRANEELEGRVKERTADLARTVESLQDEVARRELAETTLWERSKILDAFFRHATTPLVILDRKFNFLRVNAAYALSCQKSADDFPGHNHFEFYPHAENQAIFQRVVDTKKPYQVFAKPFSFPDHPEWGVTYWDWTLTPLLDDAGEVDSLVFSLEDVTQQTVAQQEVRAAGLYARGLIEAGLDPLVTISPEGKIADVNDATEQATGVAREDLIGKEFSDFFTNPDLARRGYRKALKEGQVRDYPLTIRHASGRTMDVLCHLTVYRDENGQVRGVLASARDVTERKQAEEALRASHEELRQLNAQLRELASELTLAEQRERQRLAQILHDHLQQLLVGAKFHMLPLLRAEDRTQRRAAAGVDDLLSQCIEVSRNLTGELAPPILHEGGLSPALEWLVLWMKEKHGLAVSLRSDEAAEPASEDLSVLLFQAARELLFNVSKHAGVRQAEVRLAARDGRIELEVADRGKGFDPQALRQGRRTSGGFGLFSIRQRLELLGGSLRVESAPGAGTRFTLAVPSGAGGAASSAQAEAPAPRIDKAGPAPAAGQASAAGASDPEAGKIRVLLADDHLIVRQGLTRLLREERDIVVVAEASDGHEAVEQARCLRPDVVVMDVSMPDMGGVEATEILHAEAPEMAVIGLSMFEEAELAAAMRQAGAQAYLTKSGPPDDLIDAIRLHGRRAAKRKPAKPPRAKPKRAARRKGRP